MSFTTDMWSDPDLKPYMAITAHWLENILSPGGEKRLKLRASLIGFLHVPGTHTGERLAESFFYIIKRCGLESKASLLFFLIKFS